MTHFKPRHKFQDFPLQFGGGVQKGLPMVDLLT
jgi:hypothetical protein